MESARSVASLSRRGHRPLRAIPALLTSLCLAFGVGLVSPSAYADDHAASGAASIVLVVDKSGSMSGPRIVAARAAISDLAQKLGKSDAALGLVAFDSVPKTVLELVALSTPESIENARAAAQRLEAGGGTDVEPALAAAYDLLAEVDTPIRHVLLITDGQTAYGTISDRVTAHAELGVTTSTIALGQESDVSLCEQIALRGDGRHAYVADPAKLWGAIEADVMRALEPEGR